MDDVDDTQSRRISIVLSQTGRLQENPLMQEDYKLSAECLSINHIQLTSNRLMEKQNDKKSEKYGVKGRYNTYLMLTFLNGFVNGFRMRLAGDAEMRTFVLSVAFSKR